MIATGTSTRRLTQDNAPDYPVNLAPMPLGSSLDLPGREYDLRPDKFTSQERTCGDYRSRHLVAGLMWADNDMIKPNRSLAEVDADRRNESIDPAILARSRQHKKRREGAALLLPVITNQRERTRQNPQLRGWQELTHHVGILPNEGIATRRCHFKNVRFPRHDVRLPYGGA